MCIKPRAGDADGHKYGKNRPVRVHVDNKGIIAGLRNGERVSVLSQEREMQTYG